jgi:hypothetical protein
MANKKFSDFTELTGKTTTMSVVGYDGVSNIRISGVNFSRKTTVAKTVSYVILDNDGYDRIEVDTTSGNITITLPTRADNLGRRVEIANVKGGTNKVIIADDGGGSKITSDGLATVWLPKIGDYIVLQECATSGFWEVIEEKISCQLVLNTQAGVGSTDNKIMRLTNVVENFGNMFSENHVSGYSGNAKGLEITINRSGHHAFTACGYDGSGGNIGFSLNSSQLSTSIDAITIANRLTYSGVYPTTGQASIEKYFVKGDIVRLHNSGYSAMTGVVFVATYKS